MLMGRLDVRDTLGSKGTHIQSATTSLISSSMSRVTSHQKDALTKSTNYYA